MCWNLTLYKKMTRLQNVLGKNSESWTIIRHLADELLSNKRQGLCSLVLASLSLGIAAGDRRAWLGQKRRVLNLGSAWKSQNGQVKTLHKKTPITIASNSVREQLIMICYLYRRVEYCDCINYWYLPGLLAILQLYAVDQRLWYCNWYLLKIQHLSAIT